MVSKFTKGLIAVLLVATGASGSLALAGQPGVDPAALDVAQRYFAALKSGDTQALLALLGGKAHTYNQAQLNDPDYSQFLANRFANARFQVTGGGEQNNILFVDIAIWLNDTESTKERLILKPSKDAAGSSLHITARKELLD